MLSATSGAVISVFGSLCLAWQLAVQPWIFFATLRPEVRDEALLVVHRPLAWAAAIVIAAIIVVAVVGAILFIAWYLVKAHRSAGVRWALDIVVACAALFWVTRVVAIPVHVILGSIVYSANSTEEEPIAPAFDVVGRVDDSLTAAFVVLGVVALILRLVLSRPRR